MMQGTEDRGQRIDIQCGYAATAGRGLSSVLCPLSSERGFTLPEMIAVIVITGIIAAGVAVFIRAPVQGYVDSVRRAEMSDIADTALRRMGRDIRLALPNSVRVAGGGTVIELLQTRSGGRYRAEVPGDALNFNIGDSSFEVLGPQPAVATNDEMAVYNLGIPDADAYAGNTLSTHNRRPLTIAGNIVSLTSAARLPFASPAQRFHVISGAVSYVCDTAAGQLKRYWGYSIQPLQSAVDTVAELDALTTPATATRGNALLASNVSVCSFSYDAFVVAQRAGLVTMRLGITEQGETVNLYHAAHVDNVP